MPRGGLYSKLQLELIVVVVDVILIAVLFLLAEIVVVVLGEYFFLHYFTFRFFDVHLEIAYLRFG